MVSSGEFRRIIWSVLTTIQKIWVYETLRKMIHRPRRMVSTFYAEEIR